MRTQSFALRLGRPALFWICLAATSVAFDYEYSAIDLGTLGGDASEALGLNNAGQVVGWSLDHEGCKQAFLWANGTMTGLGFLPGGQESVATAINDQGAVTGYSYVSPSNYHAHRVQAQQ